MKSVAQLVFLLSIFQMVLIVLPYSYFVLNYMYSDIIRPKPICTDLKYRIAFAPKDDNNNAKIIENQLTGTQTQKPNQMLLELCSYSFHRSQHLDLPFNKGIQVQSVNKKGKNVGYFKMVLFEEQPPQLPNNQQYLLHLQQTASLVETKTLNINPQTIQTTKKLILEELKLNEQHNDIIEMYKGGCIDEIRRKVLLYHSVKTAVVYQVRQKKQKNNNQEAKQIVDDSLNPSIRFLVPNDEAVNMNNRLFIYEATVLVLIIAIVNVAERTYTKTKFLKYSKQLTWLMVGLGLNLAYWFMNIDKEQQQTNSDLNLKQNASNSLVESYMRYFQLDAFESTLNAVPELLLITEIVYCCIVSTCTNTILDDNLKQKLKYYTAILISLLILFSLFPSIITHFIFTPILIIVCGCLLSANKKSNGLTQNQAAFSVNIIIMVIVQIGWFTIENQSEDFTCRYFYQQIFLKGILLSLFRKEDMDSDFVEENNRKKHEVMFSDEIEAERMHLEDQEDDQQQQQQ